MYSVPGALATHFNARVTTLCEYWVATLADGTVYGFTDHDRDVMVNGVTCKAGSGFDPSAIVQTLGAAMDTSELVGLITGAVIKRDEIIAGRWDGARIEHGIVNYVAPGSGVMKLPGVTLGEFSVLDEQIVAEARGIKQLIQQAIGWTVQPDCRYDFGDAKCTKDVEALRVSFAVTAVDSQQVFYDTNLVQADDYFGDGELTWTSGLNNGLKLDVRNFANAASEGKFTLLVPAPYAIAVNDTGTVIPGCRKRFEEDCKTKHNNAVNFGAEHRVPGLIATLKAPG